MTFKQVAAGVAVVLVSSLAQAASVTKADWGTAADAAHNAVVLEAVAKMAYRTLTLKASADEVSQALLDRHYLRKHGANATYGQG